MADFANGSAFSGTTQFLGYGGGVINVSGTVVGHSGTFTMTMPAGQMMINGSCSATATGSRRRERCGNFGGAAGKHPRVERKDPLE